MRQHPIIPTPQKQAHNNVDDMTQPGLRASVRNCLPDHNNTDYHESKQRTRAVAPPAMESCCPSAGSTRTVNVSCPALAS